MRFIRWMTTITFVLKPFHSVGFRGSVEIVAMEPFLGAAVPSGDLEVKRHMVSGVVSGVRLCLQRTLAPKFSSP